jgi:hypothetical protein
MLCYLRTSQPRIFGFPTVKNNMADAQTYEVVMTLPPLSIRVLKCCMTMQNVQFIIRLVTAADMALFSHRPAKIADNSWPSFPPQFALFYRRVSK